MRRRSMIVGPLVVLAISGVLTAGAKAAGSGAPRAAAGSAAPRRATGSAAPRTATGDRRWVRRPAVPATCRRLRAAEATSTGAFDQATEAAPPDTGRIQAALDACAGTGEAVELAGWGGDNAFLSAPLRIWSRETLLVDDGATLYASRRASDYQIPGADTCGTITANGNGCQPFIAIEGSHAGVMGTRGRDGHLGVIDGRGEMTMLGSTSTWWDVAEAAKSGGNQNNPKLVQGEGADDVTIYQIELRNSPMYHILMTGGDGLTVWGVMIDTPAAGARNTDGIDPESERNVTIAHDMVQDGDDCIAIKSDAGEPAQDITVADTHCYGTHGISIGSQTAGGVSNVLVRQDTIDGYDSLGNVSTSDNGIRIKSDALAGGITQRVTYRDVCLTRVKYPLYFNPFYTSGGSSIPTFRAIVLDGIVAVNSVKGAQSLFDGYDTAHPLVLDLAHVRLDVTAQSSQDAQIGIDDSNVAPAGPDVAVARVHVGGRVPSCTFPAFGYPTS